MARGARWSAVDDAGSGSGDRGPVGVAGVALDPGWGNSARGAPGGSAARGCGEAQLASAMKPATSFLWHADCFFVVVPMAEQQAYRKRSRCWPGYAPVPGKKPNQEGSCRKLPASRNGGVTVRRETARRKAESHAKTDAEKAAIKMKSSSPRIRAEGRRLRDRAAKRRGTKSAPGRRSRASGGARARASR